MVPGLNIIYIYTKEISWDTANCKGLAEDKYKFSVSPRDNTPLFTWLSYSHITGVQVPRLETLKSSLDSAVDQEAIASKNVLKNAIEGWKSMLAQHDRTSFKAAYCACPVAKTDCRDSVNADYKLQYPDGNDITKCDLDKVHLMKDSS